MDYALVSVPAAAVRRKPTHRQEMVSQLLFGEAVRVIREKGELWVKIRSLHDNYEGWMTNTLLQEVSKEEANQYCDYVTAGLINTIQLNNIDTQIPWGASLPSLGNGKGKIGKHSYSFNGALIKRKEQQPGEELLKKLAMPWLNAPYQWGGRSIFGVDCSGFVQVIYKMMGLDLPRDAWQQAQEGTTVKKLKEAVCGDLAFFDDKEEIVHVVEKKLMDSDFDGDALEGLQQFDDKKKINHVVEMLNRDLKKKVEKKRQRRQKLVLKDQPWIYITILIFILLIVISYLIIHRMMQQHP